MGLADCHIHTDFSDGLHSPREVVQAAARRGLPVIAVTDHDTLEGALRARDYSKARPDLGVDVIVGEEVSTLNGHVLGLFLAEFVPPRLTARRTVELIHRQGGLAVLAHPFNLYVGNAEGFPRAVDLMDDIPFDGFEAVNHGDALSFVANRKARRLADVYSLAALGSSDAHDSEFIGMACSEFDGSTAEDFRHALESRTLIPRQVRNWNTRSVLRHLRGSGKVLNRFRKLDPIGGAV